MYKGIQPQVKKVVVVEKIKRYMFSITYPRKSSRSRDNVDKYGTAGHATYDNTIGRLRFARIETRTQNM
jgi:hypothetical protein